MRTYPGVPSSGSDQAVATIQFCRLYGNRTLTLRVGIAGTINVGDGKCRYRAPKQGKAVDPGRRRGTSGRRLLGGQKRP